MYKDDAIRKSLLLTLKEWARLQDIAAEVGSNAPTGSNAGNPSWRTLIRDIASSTLIVTRKETDRE